MQQYFINVPTITISIPKIVKTGTLCTCDIIVFDIKFLHNLEFVFKLKCCAAG